MGGGGGAVSWFITIFHGWGEGGLPNLLQHSGFEMKMEGYNPFLALNKSKMTISYFYQGSMITHFVGIWKHVVSMRF